MTISILSPSVLGALGVSVAALLLSPAMSRCAHAFGGFWSSKTAPVSQAAEEIVFVDNPGSTVTAIIRIRYVGPSQKFAWVIPVPGRPTVGVSSNTVFQRLDAATTPQYWVEVAVEGTCMQRHDPEAAFGADSGTGGAPSAPDTTAAQVVKIDQGSVGPYDYVTIMVDPTLGDPAKVATDWFTTNGYDLTGFEGSVLSPYLRDGFNLLAFKLTKGTAVGAIRPVILTYESKLPMIPIRPTSVAAHGDMGIQVWVIGPSQAVPDNYKSLVINEALIDWLTGRKYVAGTLPAGGVGPSGPYVSKPSNYDAVVTAAANEAGGQGFVTELGGPASQYRNKVWSSLDAQELPMISSQTYADGIDAVFAANRRFGGWDGWKDAVQGATALPDGVTIDEFAHDPDHYRGVAKVDARRFFQLLDEKVVKPVADTAAILFRAPYLTRLYSTMSSREMTVDPAFNYNADLAQVSNIHVAKQLIECSPKLRERDAPWRINLPQGGVIVGKGSGGWPVAAGSMPANLKVVSLSTTGSGTVVKDNSEDIGMKLFGTGGATGSGMAILRPPQSGVMIGGTQTVAAHDQAVPAYGRSKPSGCDRCSVSHVGAGTRSAPAQWLPLAGVVLALRRRRPQRHAMRRSVAEGTRES
jgi:hypothetical protein